MQGCVVHGTIEPTRNLSRGFLTPKIFYCVLGVVSIRADFKLFRGALFLCQCQNENASLCGSLEKELNLKLTPRRAHFGTKRNEQLKCRRKSIFVHSGNFDLVIFQDNLT